jgi:hypothetical protein
MLSLARAMHGAARMHVEDASTTVMLDLTRLQRTDIDLPDLHRHVRDVDFALARLCDALECPGADTDDVARRAFHIVLALGQLLDGADSEDRRTSDILDLTRIAVAELLDTLSPFVSNADLALRMVVLDGTSIDLAMQWLHAQR